MTFRVKEPLISKELKRLTSKLLETKKNSFTTVDTITASGKVLPAYVILRNLKKVPDSKKVSCPSNVVLTVSQSGSMDDVLMYD